MRVPKGLVRLEGASILRKSVRELAEDCWDGPIGIVYRNNEPSIVILNIEQWEKLQSPVDKQTAST